MRRLLLVANPSSSGFTGALHRDVVATLSEKFEVNTIWPVNPAATRARSADAAEEGYETVIAMGGDGVVHHVANGLIHTEAALGIIPAGTTNVVARIHGMPRDPRKAAQALLEAHPEPTSVVHITTDSESGARSEHALFSVGVGFDADVVEAAEHWPHSKLWFRIASLRPGCSGPRLRTLPGEEAGPDRGCRRGASARGDGVRPSARPLYVLRPAPHATHPGEPRRADGRNTEPCRPHSRGTHPWPPRHTTRHGWPQRRCTVERFQKDRGARRPGRAVPGRRGAPGSCPVPGAEGTGRRPCGPPALIRSSLSRRDRDDPRGSLPHRPPH